MFTLVGLKQVKCDVTEDTVHYEFTHQFTSYGRDVIFNGNTSEYDISIIVRVAWDNENGRVYQDYVYNNEFVKTVTSNTTAVFTFDMTGLSEYENVTLKPMVVTSNGAEYSLAEIELN